MTKTSKRTLVVATAGIAFSLLLVGSHAKVMRPDPIPLGIELALKKPFYVPAGKTTKIFIRVPLPGSTTESESSISAIRIEPRMEDDKLRVTVYALEGEPDDLRTCDDWNSVKARLVDSYLARMDEEVPMTKLKDLGVTMGNEPLTFRAVPKRVLSPLPPQDMLAGNCECGACGGTNCCANPGMCLECGSCGFVCCSR